MATKTKAKKQSSSKASAEMPSAQSQSRKKAVSSEMMTKILVVLLALQLLLSVGILISFLSSQDDIDDIDERVEAMDTFFASYVDGYNSPNLEDNSDDEKTVGTTTGTTTTGSSGSTTTATIDIVGEPTEGSADAPVTVIEFSDYECPFCGRFYSQSYGQLKEEYIDTGLVKFVYKDFPLSFHPTAEPAAIAANCVQRLAGDEKYFEYHNVLFENQASLTDANLKTWALELGGIAESDYNSCIVDPAIASEIQEDLAEGTLNGVSGTPSFFINGELIVGAQPYSVIKQAIDAQLNG